MWDDARLLRGIANTLFVACALMVLYGSAYYFLHRPSLFPLHSLRLEAAPQYTVASEVLEVARAKVRGNLLTADLEQLREALEKLPWVRTVSIRREFPDRLVVSLEEHQALARWNGSMLVNKFGEVFEAQTEQALPSFNGPVDSAAEVTMRYEQFVSMLSTVDIGIRGVRLSDRHAWQLNLSNGIVVELGREDMHKRLARFVEVYPYSIAAQTDKFKYVDLRYRNGFAVSGVVNQG